MFMKYIRIFCHSEIFPRTSSSKKLIPRYKEKACFQDLTVCNIKSVKKKFISSCAVRSSLSHQSENHRRHATVWFSPLGVLIVTILATVHLYWEVFYLLSHTTDNTFMLWSFLFSQMNWHPILPRYTDYLDAHCTHHTWIKYCTIYIMDTIHWSLPKRTVVTYT